MHPKSSNYKLQLYISKTVRLNLFNHMLALFCVKFACDSLIRYLVFRWKSCKGCVWESVKNSSVWESVKISSVCAIKRILVTRTRKWLVTDDSPKCHTCEACRKLKGHDSWDTTGQKWQSCQSIIWRLELATCPSCKWVARTPCFAKKWLFTFLTYPTLNILIPMKYKVLLERILRDKP